jgi:hypothetical protein
LVAQANIGQDFVVNLIIFIIFLFVFFGAFQKIFFQLSLKLLKESYQIPKADLVIEFHHLI